MFFLKQKRRNGKEFVVAVYENIRDARKAMLKRKKSFIKYRDKSENVGGHIVGV